MMRYAAIPWPLAGLFIAVALVGQETLLNALGSNPSLTQTAYRMVVWTIGITSLALLLLPPRRIAYLLGALVCAALMGWALWLQYGLDLDPCPLCVFQRIAVISTGVIFLIAAIHNPGRGRRDVLRGADHHRLRNRRRARRVARLDPGTAEGLGRRVRNGARLHAGNVAAHRSDFEGAERQRRMRRAGMAASWDSRSRRGRSCSSSR